MYRPFEAADGDSLARAMAQSFGFPADRAPAWWDIAGRDNLRVWDDGGVCGGLVDIPMGMFVGGRSIPAHGVAGVAVAVEARGRGVGQRMMGAYVEELAGARIPLSALYASTRGLYRSVGFGIAGNAHVATVPTAAFREIGDRSPGWRRFEEADREALKAAYTEFASPDTARLDRGPYVWRRVEAHRGTPNQGWVLEEDGGIVAWLFVRQSPTKDDWLTLHVEDWGALGPAALRRVAGLLSTFSSMARTTQLRCGASLSLLEILPEHTGEVKLFEPWMLRVVDVRDALEMRGWPIGLEATLDLEVSDPLVRDNNGRFRLRIAEGRAQVNAGSDGTLKLDIRGLAGLYTGHASPWALRDRGLCSGDPEALGRAAAAFALPAPQLADFF